MADRTVRVVFEGDSSDLSRALRGIKGDVSSTSSSTSKLGGIMKGAGLAIASGAAIGAAAVGAFAYKSIGAAADLGESINKVKVVFEDSAGGILNWSKSTANALGISRQQALESAGTFGNLFTAMKIGAPESAKMSKGLVNLSADLASFNNADPTEVLEALRSGLVGETEPLRKFGVQLSAVRVEEEAMRMGLKKVKGEFTAGAKAQAAYSLILKDTEKAQGDFARTSNSLPNLQRRLSASFEDITAKLGKALLPVVTDVAEALAEFFGSKGFQRGMRSAISGIKTFARGVKAGFDIVKGVVENVKGFFDGGGKGGGMFDGLMKAARPVLRRLAPLFRAAFNAVKAVISTVVKVATALWDRFGSHLVKHARTAWNNIMQVVRGALDILTGLFNLVAAVLTGKWGKAWDAIKQILSGAWNVILGIVKGAINAISAILGALVAILSGIFRTAWNAAATAVSAGVRNVMSFFSSLGGKIVSALAGAGSWLISVGRNIIEGLISGISSMVGNAVDAVKNAVGNVVSAAWDAVKPGSPSKVFRAIGRSISEGLAAGITDKSKRALEAIKETVAAIKAKVNEFKSSIADGFSFDITAMPGMTDANGNPIAPGRKAIRRYAQRQVAQYRRFAQALQKVARMGAPPGLLQDLVAAGPEGGLELAQVLANSPKLLRQVGNAERRIDRLGNRTGQVAASQMTVVFQGNVYGFDSFEKAVSKAVHKAIQRKKKK